MESLHRDSSRIGPWLWLCCFQFFVAEQIARLGWPGHYSMARDFISDLGSARSPLHWVMNGSFMLQGLLIFFGAVLARLEGQIAIGTLLRRLPTLALATSVARWRNSAEVRGLQQLQVTF